MDATFFTVKTMQKITLCLKNTCCQIFSITLLTVNWFWKFFHCWKNELSAK